MKRVAILALLLSSCSGGRPAPPPVDTGAVERGHELYSLGKFDAAEKELERVIARNSSDSLARRLLGRIYLLKGRNKEAADQFMKFVDLVQRAEVPADAMTIQDLFFAFYRMDDYRNAADAAKLLFDSILETKYSKMATIRPPYSSTWREETSTIRSDERTGLFLIKVNGEQGKFAVDFGAGEMVLYRNFAQRARPIKVGVPGRSQEDAQAIVDLVDLPGVQVRNVPALISEQPKTPGTRSMPAQDIDIDGVIGVGFLSHFFPSFGRGRLTLRKSSRTSSGAEELPFYFAGDRTIFITGHVDGTMASYFIINPTQAGVKFIPSPGLLMQIAREKKISVDQVTSLKIKAGPYETAGDPREAAKFPPGLDAGHGFLLGGLIGAEAFKGKVVSLDFTRMKFSVE